MICLLFALPGCKGCSDEPAKEIDPRFVLPKVQEPPTNPVEKTASEAQAVTAEDPKEIAFSVAPDVLRVYRATTVSLKVPDTARAFADVQSDAPKAHAGKNSVLTRIDLMANTHQPNPENPADEP